MPSRFERYRVKDGVTHLGERYFNPVFQDIDVRLAGLEELQLSWEAAVRAVSEFGLLRINEVIGPALDEANAKIEDIETRRQAAIAALADLQAAINDFEQNAAADLAALQAAVETKADAATVEAALAEKASAADVDAALNGLRGKLFFIGGM